MLILVQVYINRYIISGKTFLKHEKTTPELFGNLDCLYYYHPLSKRAIFSVDLNYANKISFHMCVGIISQQTLYPWFIFPQLNVNT